jgi:hypothetical protein
MAGVPTVQSFAASSPSGLYNNLKVDFNKAGSPRTNVQSSAGSVYPFIVNHPFPSKVQPLGPSLGNSPSRTSFQYEPVPQSEPGPRLQQSPFQFLGNSDDPSTADTTNASNLLPTYQRTKGTTGKLEDTRYNKPVFWGTQPGRN